MRGSGDNNAILKLVKSRCLIVGLDGGWVGGGLKRKNLTVMSTVQLLVIEISRFVDNIN